MVYEGVKPPTEPPNYDPENKFKDPVAYFRHREAAVAEKMVKIGEAKVSPCQTASSHAVFGAPERRSCNRSSQSRPPALV